MLYLGQSELSPKHIQGSVNSTDVTCLLRPSMCTNVFFTR